MSANIYYEFINPKKAKSLSVLAPSRFLGAMAKSGMAIPGTVTAADLDRLQAMAAAYGDSKDNPYFDLAELLQEAPEGTEIRLWAEY